MLWQVCHRRWARALLVCYPFVTLFAVMATANHFLVDGVAGAAMMALAFVAADRILAPARGEAHGAARAVVRTRGRGGRVTRGPSRRTRGAVDRRGRRSASRRLFHRRIAGRWRGAGPSPRSRAATRRASIGPTCSRCRGRGASMPPWSGRRRSVATADDGPAPTRASARSVADAAAALRAAADRQGGAEPRRTPRRQPGAGGRLGPVDPATGPAMVEHAVARRRVSASERDAADLMCSCKGFSGMAPSGSARMNKREPRSDRSARMLRVFASRRRSHPSDRQRRRLLDGRGRRRPAATTGGAPGQGGVLRRAAAPGRWPPGRGSSACATASLVVPSM